MKKWDFETASKTYWSNCMMEAVKAKFRNPKVKIYFCRPRITENGHFQMFHFMWSDGEADYDFSDLEENGLPPWRNLFFKGAVRKFDLGFAERYCRYRNGRRGRVWRLTAKHMKGKRAGNENIKKRNRTD